MLALRPVRVEPVSLSALAAVAGATPDPAADVHVTGITHDSRAVQPGDLYAALAGAHVHGAAFAGDAVERGAVAVLSDHPIEGTTPTLVVADPRKVLGAVSAAVFGEPSRKLAVYGVTGTNGKTTTAYLLEAGLRAAGRTTGLIGTIESHVAGEVVPSVRTTPEATELQALLAVMVERGVQACAIEVSSHALALGRVAGTRFAAALFTNLSQDHLDFHADMEDYFAAKAMLFTPAFTDLAVIDVADPWGARLADEVRGVEVVRVGADARARTQLLGDFNERNAALAVAALAATGIAPDVAASGVASLTGVPGRLERIDEGQDYLAVVDYAHTPAAVTRLLAALRPLSEGRLIVVLGCGGDRDAGKRPLMGAAAATGSDVAILTDDNPRSERSADILAAMLAGVPVDARDRVAVEPDRARAIARAVALAQRGDTVVVAGKGHETGQDVGGVVTPFDDRDVLRHSIIEAGRP
ncbi:MAG TPA: UDP-N-acetylmuramoyl-L-alanyl-D-glutamate--2,6-diaminopimelate ligase [Mycobacteriales bacterium]|nr:UDP-N-acetylmuramoyl-L-alanyl-D-glutamate--2,6-diaminopimelate ligase [Mycobacteriales bacterium]